MKSKVINLGTGTTSIQSGSLKFGRETDSYDDDKPDVTHTVTERDVSYKLTASTDRGIITTSFKLIDDPYNRNRDYTLGFSSSNNSLNLAFNTYSTSVVSMHNVDTNSIYWPGRSRQSHYINQDTNQQKLPKFYLDFPSAKNTLELKLASGPNFVVDGLKMSAFISGTSTNEAEKARIHNSVGVGGNYMIPAGGSSLNIGLAAMEGNVTLSDTDITSKSPITKVDTAVSFVMTKLTLGLSYKTVSVDTAIENTDDIKKEILARVSAKYTIGNTTLALQMESLEQ